MRQNAYSGAISQQTTWELFQRTKSSEVLLLGIKPTASHVIQNSAAELHSSPFFLLRQDFSVALAEVELAV